MNGIPNREDDAVLKKRFCQIFDAGKIKPSGEAGGFVLPFRQIILFVRAFRKLRAILALASGYERVAFQAPYEARLRHIKRRSPSPLRSGGTETACFFARRAILP